MAIKRPAVMSGTRNTSKLHNQAQPRGERMNTGSSDWTVGAGFAGTHP